jgi:hypothetical protein
LLRLLPADTARVQSVIEQLQAVPTRLPNAVRREADGGLPSQPGLYAWWGAPGLLPGIHGPAHPLVPGVELLYVGIAPDDPSSQQTVRTRVMRNHARRTGQSTLRRGLAALLWTQQDWTPAQKGGRPTLNPASEAELTAWMRGNLSLTWAVHPKPWLVEPAVIAQLNPPLNLDDNTGHPLYPLVRAARDHFLQAAKEAGAVGLA